ncbi:MAG: amino acid adenylation domain protein [Pedosphaera sp.]|nr:amino acid adenylation domain protein [Pedosphaera sp.]
MDGNSVFRFPTAVAAAAAFKSQAPELALTHDAISPQRTAKPPPPGAMPRQGVRYGWIARQARSPEQIAKLIPRETRHPTTFSSPHVPPKTALQCQLCELWGQILQFEQIGIHDDFFELGGTSQLAVRLLAKWTKLTGQQLSLATLFKAPTIEKLAAELDR